MQRLWRVWCTGRGACSFLCVLVLAALVAHASAVCVRVDDCTIPAPGETAECRIFLDQAPAGLRGYEMTVTIKDPEIAEITGVKFPSWAGLNSRGKVPADSVMIKGADTANKIGQGTRDVVLATLVIRGDAPGSCSLEVSVSRMEDEAGVTFPTDGRAGMLSIGGIDVEGVSEFPQTVVTLPAIPVLTYITPAEIVSTPVVTQNPAISPVFPDPMSSPPATSQPTTVTTVPTPVKTAVPTTSPPTTVTTVPTPVKTAVPTTSPPTTATTIPISSGAVTIASDPTGALVMVDGEIAGTTPLTLSLGPGTHTLDIRGGGDRAWKGEIEILPGQSLYLPVLVLKAPPVYTIEAEAAPNGTVFPSGGFRVKEGSQVTFTFTPDPGFELENVSLDGEWIGPEKTVVLSSISSDHRLEGRFIPILPPSADFSANLTRGTCPLAVGFTAGSEDGIEEYWWDFGDGALSEDPQPVHLYTMPGNYSVTLLVCAEGGCDRLCREDYIRVIEQEPLVPDFTANRTNGSAPLHVQFTDLSTGDPGWCVWDFGDGGRSTNISPVHVYARPGVYNVTLTAGTDGRTAREEKPGFINVTSNVREAGYLRISCNVEKARVYLDGQYSGSIDQGCLVVPVRVEGTPCRTITVRAEGYLPFSASLTQYPGAGETVEVEVFLTSYIQSGVGLERLSGSSGLSNLTQQKPSQWA